MNKIKQELYQKLQGQLSDEKTLVDVNVAYDVVLEKAVLFSLFFSEFYHTEFETWTGNPLPKGKFQDRKSYDIISIKEVLNKFLEEYDK